MRASSVAGGSEKIPGKFPRTPRKAAQSRSTCAVERRAPDPQCGHSHSAISPSSTSVLPCSGTVSQLLPVRTRVKLARATAERT